MYLLHLSQIPEKSKHIIIVRSAFASIQSFSNWIKGSVFIRGSEILNHVHFLCMIWTKIDWMVRSEPLLADTLHGLLQSMPYVLNYVLIAIYCFYYSMQSHAEHILCREQPTLHNWYCLIGQFLWKGHGTVSWQMLIMCAKLYHNDVLSCLYVHHTLTCRKDNLVARSVVKPNLPGS